MRVRPVFLGFLIVALVLGAAVFLFAGEGLPGEHVVELTGPGPSSFPDAPSKVTAPAPTPEATTTKNNSPFVLNKLLDAPPQEPLANPPSMIKAIYATSWAASSKTKVDYFLKLIKETELNAIVIDIKDYSGYVTYATDFDLAKQYDAIEVRIPKLNSLIQKLHNEGIYVIARLAVFQDQRLALARPDLALVASSTGKTWRDKKGLAWIDAASKDAWAYNAGIAKDAFSRGFDEVNFDYVRFASDGNLGDLQYPAWDKKTPRATVIKNFWSYVRSELPGKHISADLFGLTTVNHDDLGIGQKLENAFPSFNDIAPMVYPSHYASGSFGFTNPAANPYEIIKYSMDAAFKRLATYRKNLIAAAALAASTTPEEVPASAIPEVRFRPWLQDFDLGADYTADMVKKEIQAVYDAASSTPELLSGWMLWNPSNIYTKDALEVEPQ